MQSLEAERNHLPSFKGDDLLTFSAVTRNPKGDDFIAIPADLNFAGAWDLEGNKLVFVSEVKRGVRPNVSIGFAGRIAGVTAEFVYFASYDLNLQGTFVYSNLSLTFAIQYTNIAGAQSFHPEISGQGRRDQMKANLALILNVDQNKANTQLSVSFQLEVTSRTASRSRPIRSRSRWPGRARSKAQQQASRL